MADRTLTITLIRSPIGEKPRTRATVEALGLRKLHQTVEQADNPGVRGMIDHVRHLVAVVENAEA